MISVDGLTVEFGGTTSSSLAVPPCLATLVSKSMKKTV